MGHIFISYSHEDKDSRRLLVRKLLSNGFKRDEIWYDKNIEAGEHWIPHIEEQLANASCLVVIVTKSSMKSLYVTYEWSFALGNALPVIPLLFKNSYDCIHARLRDIHTLDCRKKISNTAIQQIKEKLSDNSDAQYLNRLIVEAVMPARVLMRVALWFYDYRQTPEDRILFNDLMNDGLDLVNAFNTALPKLMVDKSPAFNTKQRRMCRNLSNTMSDLWETFMVPMNFAYFVSSPSLEDDVPVGQKIWAEEIEPAISFFHMSHHFELGYKELNDVLGALSAGQTSYVSSLTPPPMFIKWIYPENDNIQNKIKMALDIVSQRISGKLGD